MPVSSQKPVQRFSAQSFVKSNGKFRLFARYFAAMTILSHGFSQYLSLACSANNRACSGWSSRHFLVLFRQYSGSASYAAFFEAFRFPRSLRSIQSARLLCQSIACLCEQNFGRFSGSGAPQVKQFLEFWVMPRLYTQNSLMARS